jgi:diguanylate cyclase (GGDEF)-like protein
MMSARHHIEVLLVEDNPIDALLVQRALSAPGPDSYHLSQAETLQVALTALEHFSFDVILLDLTLPDSQGMDTFHGVRTAYPRIPILVLSGLTNEDLAIQAVQHGAQDYLVKRCGSEDMIPRSIRYAMERKRAQDHVIYLAHYDHLTGLPNRTLFFDRLTYALKQTQRSEGLIALLFVDLDQFKAINDSLGHVAGDLLLKKISDRLRSCFLDSDTIARMGGDEFTVLLEDISGIAEVTAYATQVLMALSSPTLIETHQVYSSASIGITVFPFDDADAHTLLKHADIAMYRAKKQGGNNFQYYLAGMGDEVASRLTLANELHRGLANNEFFLHYQPLVNLKTGTITGMESLLRWQHPDRGLISPGEFIPIAEESGLMNPLGNWILHHACHAGQQLQGMGIPSYSIAVNVSGRQFCQQNLTSHIEETLRITGLNPACLEIELTEDFLMEDSTRNLTTLHNIRNMGVKISVDDFGTGYASLRYLKSFPLDTLKIDRSFIHDLIENPTNAKLVAAMIGIGHNLGLTVIAEGVETEEQMQFLQQHGCDQAQGYFFAHPQAMDTLIPLLEQGSPFASQLSL